MSGSAGRKVYLVGAGMGGAGQMTEAARACVRKAQAVAGARRMVESAAELIGGKPSLPSYRAGEIAEWLLGLGEEIRTAAVLFSGDTGFYSGAKEAAGVFREAGWEVELVPGISSLSYLAAKLGRDWQETRVVSLHGREGRFTEAVREYPSCFFLLGGSVAPADFLAALLDAGLGERLAAFGAELSYPGEQVIRGTVRELAESGRAAALPGLACAMVWREDGTGLSSGRALGRENGAAREADPSLSREQAVPGPAADAAAAAVRAFSLRDGDFIRGRVPMTKEEVRTLSLAKLRLTPGAVCYDVGAGTGSVAVAAAAALEAMGGRVYAVERNPEGAELIRKNRDALLRDPGTVTVVEGRAPEALAALPAPTHAFIGGSGGDLEEIVRVLLEKNPAVRVVVNAVTLETMAQCVKLMGSGAFSETEAVQAGVSRAEKAGPYHMQRAGNPVFIVTLQGAGTGERKKSP